MKDHHHRHGIRGRCETLNFLDEFLEELWLETEKKNKELMPGFVVERPVEPEIKKIGVAEGFLKEEDGKIVVTEKGVEKAKQLVRSHRLAERLLADILNFQEDEVEQVACRFEHILDDSAVDSVCALLGHPRTCPHGNPIPEGKCCLEGEYVYRPLVVPLTELEPGEEAEVKYLGTTDNSKLAHLTSFGFLPGQKIVLLKKFPAYVVAIDETTVSFDREIARIIFVKPKKHMVERQKKFRWGLRWRQR